MLCEMTRSGPHWTRDLSPGWGTPLDTSGRGCPAGGGTGGATEPSMQVPRPKWQEQQARDQGEKAKERVCALMASTKFCHVASSSSWAPAPQWYSGLRDPSSHCETSVCKHQGKEHRFTLALKSRSVCASHPLCDVLRTLGSLLSFPWHWPRRCQTKSSSRPIRRMTRDSTKPQSPCAKVKANWAADTGHVLWEESQVPSDSPLYCSLESAATLSSTLEMGKQRHPQGRHPALCYLSCFHKNSFHSRITTVNARDITWHLTSVVLIGNSAGCGPKILQTEASLQSDSGSFKQQPLIEHLPNTWLCAC